MNRQIDIGRRPKSHRRLCLAMAISSLLVAASLAILAWMINAATCNDESCFEEPEHLVVLLDNRENDIRLEPAPPVQEAPDKVEPQEIPEQPEVAEPVPEVQVPETSVAESPVDDMQPEKDAYTIGHSVAREAVAARFEQEDVRERMWRQTASVMFADTGEFDFEEPETIIAAQKFRVPVGVLGIGLTIGGCFFGIPLAGIPVEERSAGPTVIYCAEKYQ